MHCHCKNPWFNISVFLWILESFNVSITPEYYLRVIKKKSGWKLRIYLFLNPPFYGVYRNRYQKKKHPAKGKRLSESTVIFKTHSLNYSDMFRSLSFSRLYFRPSLCASSNLSLIFRPTEMWEHIQMTKAEASISRSVIIKTAKPMLLIWISPNTRHESHSR